MIALDRVQWITQNLQSWDLDMQSVGIAVSEAFSHLKQKAYSANECAAPLYVQLWKRYNQDAKGGQHPHSVWFVSCFVTPVNWSDYHLL